MAKRNNVIHFVAFLEHDKYHSRYVCDSRISYLIDGADSERDVDEQYNTFDINKVTCQKCKESLLFKKEINKLEYPLFNLPEEYYKNNRRNNAKRNTKKTTKVISKSNKWKKQKSCY